MKITQIYIYPIKSLGGISVQTAEVQERGLKYDRRWLLIDENNRFLTQRSLPQMALFEVKITENGLEIRHRGNEALSVLIVPFEPQTIDYLNVTVWGDAILAQRVSNEADAWFSKALAQNVRLVYMPDTSPRLADARYAPFDNNVSFADGFPYLIIGQSSLDDLNARLEEPITMQRFRPNLVFEGGLPHEEDTWRDFSIGVLNFIGVKPCARCEMTMIDPQTAQKGKEPLRTLASYRSQNNKILFGQNVLAKSCGTLRIGDELLIGS